MTKYCVETVEKFSKDDEEFTTRSYYGKDNEIIYTVTGYEDANCDVDSEIARQNAVDEKGFVDQETATKFANSLLSQPEMKKPGIKIVSVKVL